MNNKSCASHHFGPWMIEPEWFKNQVAAIESGVLAPQGKAEPSPYDVVGQVAVIPIEGALMKIRSKYGGTSTVDARSQIRAAMTDPAVKAILLHIDSPGGTAAGTEALAQDVADAAAKMPVHAHIEDMGASAAYYVASQAHRITASKASLVGSLGTKMTVVDSSGMAEKQGLKVHEITTGEYKGAGADGVPLTDKQLTYFQKIVNDYGEHFKNAVQRGRHISREQTDALFDGRVHDADTAKTIGLIDDVASLDAAMQAITDEVTRMTQEAFNAYMVEHPEAVAGEREKGKKAGIAEARAEARAEAVAIRDACGKHFEIALEAICTGQSVEAAKAIVLAVEKSTADSTAKLAEQAKEIERLKAQAGTQGAVAIVGTIKADAKATPNYAEIADPKARAKAEWDGDQNIRNQFVDEKTYCAYRVAELEGRVRVQNKKQA